MFKFSSFQLMPIYANPGHLKKQFFLLFNTAWIFLTCLPSPLPLTCYTHVVFLQRNLSQCVQIWIFDISNTDSFTQLIHLWCITTKVNMRFFFLSVYFQFNLGFTLSIYSIYLPPFYVQPRSKFFTSQCVNDVSLGKWLFFFNFGISDFEF